jgi:hypothetical protein
MVCCNVVFGLWYCRALFLDNTLNSDQYLHSLMRHCLPVLKRMTISFVETFLNGISLNCLQQMQCLDVLDKHVTPEFCLINYLHVYDVAGSGQLSLYISTHVISCCWVSYRH